MQTTLQYLPSLSCGAALRAAISHVLDYARVNAQDGSDTPNLLDEFADSQIALLDVAHGDPADGVWLGVGVPDPRILCYKAASEYRLTQSTSAKSELISLYTDIKNVAAQLPGFVAPEVVVATTSLSADGEVPDKNGQPA
ncbi:hypothetical protein P2_0009 [Aeromonas phage P2]|uniref:Uncharacterized protein n=2 Tax=Viruses TaxID=10239 RepID=A0A9E8GDN2_9CAUD|nr:hypothetical protein P2_0009 [Aeromonas phage P2]